MKSKMNTSPSRQKAPYESPAMEIYGMEPEAAILTTSIGGGRFDYGETSQSEGWSQS
jgi:hypothetical protein